MGQISDDEWILIFLPGTLRNISKMRSTHEILLAGFCLGVHSAIKLVILTGLCRMISLDMCVTPPWGMSENLRVCVVIVSRNFKSWTTKLVPQWTYLVAYHRNVSNIQLKYMLPVVPTGSCQLGSGAYCMFTPVLFNNFWLKQRKSSSSQFCLAEFIADCCCSHGYR